MYKYCVNIFKTLRTFFAVHIFFLPTLNGKVFFSCYFLLLNPNSNFSSVLMRMLFLSMESLNISMPEQVCFFCFFPVSSIVYTSYSLHCDAT